MRKKRPLTNDDSLIRDRERQSLRKMLAKSKQNLRNSLLTLHVVQCFRRMSPTMDLQDCRCVAWERTEKLDETNEYMMFLLVR